MFFGASQIKGRPNVWGAMIALLALATGIKGIQLTFSGSSRWIEPLFYGLSLLGAVSLASRSQVSQDPERRSAPPRSTPARRPAIDRRRRFAGLSAPSVTRVDPKNLATLPASPIWETA